MRVFHYSRVCFNVSFNNISLVLLSPVSISLFLSCSHSGKETHSMCSVLFPLLASLDTLCIHSLSLVSLTVSSHAILTHSNAHAHLPLSVSDLSIFFFFSFFFVTVFLCLLYSLDIAICSYGRARLNEYFFFSFFSFLEYGDKRCFVFHRYHFLLSLLFLPFFVFFFFFFKFECFILIAYSPRDGHVIRLTFSNGFRIFTQQGQPTVTTLSYRWAGTARRVEKFIIVIIHVEKE
ncbi:unnamed protein product [Xylocopa violacea]|uniref:T. brucei spp.-specific protein n=1 Tax=Xylocopa violacea TaxID=135666 RepID=A0ABP1N4U2_XYLVO